MNDLARERAADRRALLLAGSALWLIGAFAGTALCRSWNPTGEAGDRLIERWFVGLFYKCHDPSDVLYVVADCFFHELIPYLAVWLAGYTLFTGAVSGAALVRDGLLFGYALTMLQFSSKTGLFLDAAAYLVSSLALASLLILLSAAAFGFYYPERRAALFGRESLRYTGVFLRIAALVLVNVTGTLFLIYLYF